MQCYPADESTDDSDSESDDSEESSDEDIASPPDEVTLERGRGKHKETIVWKLQESIPIDLRTGTRGKGSLLNISEGRIEMVDEEGLRQQQQQSREEKITIPVLVPINPYGDSHTREEDERQIQQYLEAVEVRVLVNRMRLITSRISRRAAERNNTTTTTTTM